MLPKDMRTLPSWASYQTYAEDDPAGETGHVKLYGRGEAVCIVANADAMYPALLEEFRDLYPQGSERPDFFRDPKGKTAAAHDKAWDKALAALHEDDVADYWLETLYQSAKMDLQRVAGFNIVINIKHLTNGEAGKDRWKQSNAPSAGVTAKQAAGGSASGRDARHHYKKLRGFLVA